LLLSLIFNQIQKVRFPLQTSINKVAMQEWNFANCDNSHELLLIIFTMPLIRFLDSEN
jgi:hypothetical protein